jgi:hypothetical protein
MDTRVSYPSGAATRLWAGALTSSSFRVNADFEQDAAAARLVVSANSDLSNPAFVSDWAPVVNSFGINKSYHTVKLTATGLQADTTYYYRLESQGAPNQNDTARTIKTAPAAASAFSFVFGSCTLFPTTSFTYDPIFPAIAADNPLFYMHIGDVDYSDVTSTDIRFIRDVRSRVYRRRKEVDDLHRTVPIVRIWDDHDSGANDNTLDTANAAAIYANGRAVMLETEPLYDLVNPNVLTQVFDIGAVRFIVPDCRSQRRPGNSSIMGRGLGSGDNWDQLSWLTGSSGPLLTAAAAGIKQIFLIISSTWTGGAPDSYDYTAYVGERSAICTAALACGTPVTLLCGDAHESAFDDGTNSGGLAQILSSPLAQTTTLTGSGPYSWLGQTSTNRFQNNRSIYCMVDVSANNVHWTATMKGNPFSGIVPTTLGSVSSTQIR